jgi:transposase
MAERVAQENWYVTATCSYCGEIIPISEARPPQNYSYFTQPKASSLTCPLCKHVDNYQPAVMMRRKVKSEIGGVLKFE